ncbi:pirin family protein [Catenovulum sp. SM1970]|uniref:pirin family protein n=1 Tax=Marinifaba aquimaris TaxID=2741323 RepID=UPI0015716AD4|nr:pirin family protein [Marinifaba aquimaris]NTS78298.1 pirin family protein [Marinifaba aquimaris]
MQVLHFNELPQGGFNGLTEKRFVTDRRVFQGRAHEKAFDGLGNFVYLADASYLPFGETKMHSHSEIDVISVMGSGRVSHEGSLEHGKDIEANMAQVQRAGAEGFAHNEINPEEGPNQLIQIWVLPDQLGERAGYKTYQFKHGELTKIYGGSKAQDDTFYSQTALSVGLANKGDTFTLPGELMAYLPKGDAIINGEAVKAQSLIKVENGIDYQAQDDDAMIIFIYHDDAQN